MKNYIIRKYNPEDRPIWDAFIAEAKNATFLFKRNFMDYHCDRFDDFSILIFDGFKIIAALPANRVGDRLYSHQGLSYGGLVLSTNFRFESVLEMFRMLLNFVATQGIDEILLKQLPDIYGECSNNTLDYLLFKVNAALTRRDCLSVIDLRKEYQYSENKRRNIKKAAGLGMKVIETDDFSTFWNTILIPNLQQKHRVAPVHTLSEINLLRSRFPQNIRQFNVWYNGKIVGGTTIFETALVAHCQYISGDAAHNDKGSLDFMFDYLIRNIYPDKAYFDFGISNENNGQQINQGLLHWKEGFGAKLHNQNFYTLPVANAHLLADLLI